MQAREVLITDLSKEREISFDLELLTVREIVELRME